MGGVKEESRILRRGRQSKESGYPYNKDIRESQDAATSSNHKKCLAGKNELPYKGHCEEHSAPNHFKCINCNKYICGTCVVLVHKICPKVFPVLNALKLMKGEKLKKIKIFKTKLEKEAKILDSKLDHLNQEQEKLNQVLEETKSKKKRNQKLLEDSSCHEDNLEKATSNEDYDKVDAEVKFFLEENCCGSILLPPSILAKEEARKLTKKDLEENTFYVTKGNQEAMKYSKVKVKDDQISFEGWEEKAEEGSLCANFLDFISSRTSVIDTHKFIEEHKKELHNPQLPKDRIKFSQIEVKERSVYFHSFKVSGGSDTVLEFRSLLKTLGCSSAIPNEAFLMYQITSGEGQVVITTDGGSPRALNFLLLASGIMDDSYQGTKSSKFSLYVAGGYKMSRGCSFPAVVEGIQDGGIYERKERKRGNVEGEAATSTNKLSFFGVWKKNDSRSSASTFGRVKRGMEVVDKIKDEYSVEKCGLLFYFNPVIQYRQVFVKLDGLKTKSVICLIK